MIFFDLSLVPFFIIWTGIIVCINIFGFIKTKSWLIVINLAISLLLLLLHTAFPEEWNNWAFDVICDMVYLALSIALFLYVNDIEARRRIISEVFENRYSSKEKSNSKKGMTK